MSPSGTSRIAAREPARAPLSRLRCWSANLAEVNENRNRLADEPWRKIYSTERWKRIRAIARRRAGGLCERCGREAKALDVHHRVALKDGGEPYDPDNLEVVCRPCHRAIETPASPFLGSRSPTSTPVDTSPPAGRNPRKDGPARAKGWYSPGGVRCSRQWLPEWTWVGSGSPPPGTSLADLDAHRPG